MESIDLRDYIRPLQRWWWLLLASTLVATAASLLVTLQQPTQYSSRATLMVGASIRDPNPNSGEIYLAQQLVNTYVDLSQRASVRDPAMAALGLTWLPPYTTRQVPNTQLMEINVLDTDPVRAQAVGQALIDQLIALSPAGSEEQERTNFIEGELNALQTSIIATKAEIEQRQNALQEMFSARQIADAQAQINALQSKLSTLQTNYTSLLSTTQKGAVNNLTVIEPPGVGAPVDSRLLFQVLTAAAIGFMLAAGGAYLIEYMDRTFKNSDEVQGKLKLPTLSAIPIYDEGKKARGKGRRKGSDDDSSAGLVMLQGGHSMAAEAFRVLRTNLQFTAVTQPLHRMVITSPLPGEGKSSICANLAVAAAQAGNRVIVLDCDLHRPRQHRLFGLVNNVGLTTALLSPEEVDVTRFTQPTALPTLRVMTTGPLPPNPAELLGSLRMRRLLETLEAHADIVLMDTPPASVLADAAVLSLQSDGVLLVLAAGETSYDVGQRTVAALQQVQAHILGAVLNRMPTRGGGYYYYHYYNYQYSQKYYRRKDKLAGAALPVAAAALRVNGAGAAQDAIVEERSGMAAGPES